MLAAIHFTQTITLGSILLGMLVGAFGLMTAFAKWGRSTWRDLAEARAEKIRELTDQLVDERAQHTREIRAKDLELHDAKDEGAILTSKVASLEDKTDVLKLVEEQKNDNKELIARVAEILEPTERRHALGVDALASEIAKMHKQLADQLARHEERVANVTDEQLGILRQIADALATGKAAS